MLLNKIIPNKNFFEKNKIYYIKNNLRNLFLFKYYLIIFLFMQ